MTLDDLVKSLPVWLNPGGPEADTVISSRLRLARNLADMPYAHRVDTDTLHEIEHMIIDASVEAGYRAGDYIRTGDFDDVHRDLMVERHLISPRLAQFSDGRGIIVKNGERESIMVNEEDHIRIQLFRSGFDLLDAWEEIDSLDDRISHGVKYSYSRRYGFLTACPTNFGTGLRASILIHLPALVLTKEMQKVMRSAAQLGLAVRGYYGEGSDVVGNLFQISNQTSLGRSEHDIIDAVTSVANRILDYENKAADLLMKEARHQVEDKIWRSVGILKTARVMSTQEFMNLSSAVRFGHKLGFIADPGLRALNELMVMTQPGHLQAREGSVIEAQKRDIVRADMVRKRFVDVNI